MSEGAAGGEPSVGRLVEQLSEQTSRLVKAEVALAKAEVAEKAKNAGIGIGLMAFAGLVVAYAVGVLIWAAVLGLGEAWPLWLSALVIGFALVLFAGLLVLVGVKLLQKKSEGPGPAERVKDDVTAVKTSFSLKARKPADAPQEGAL